MGTLYKGLFRRGKVFWLRYTVAGKQVRISLETEHEGDAIAKALRIRQDPELSPVDEATVELERYLRKSAANGSLTANSIESRKKVLENFLRDYGVKALAQITTPLARSWYKDLTMPGPRQVTETTAQGYIMRLRGFVSWLVDEHKLRSNPVAEVKLNRICRIRRKNFLSAAQVAKLIKDAPDEAMRFILYCGFHAGMRKAEIIEARPEWFDLKAGGVTITATDTFIPKDRDTRTVPLTKDFKAFLKKYKLRSPYMLHPEVEHFKWRYRWDFRRPFAEYMEEKKITCNPHDMRRTFASLRVQAGVSIYKVAKWLGDGVQVVTDHYGHLSPQDEDIEIS